MLYFVCIICGCDQQNYNAERNKQVYVHLNLSLSLKLKKSEILNQKTGTSIIQISLVPSVKMLFHLNIIRNMIYRFHISPSSSPESSASDDSSEVVLFWHDSPNSEHEQRSVQPRFALRQLHLFVLHLVFVHPHFTSSVIDFGAGSCVVMIGTHLLSSNVQP